MCINMATAANVLLVIELLEPTQVILLLEPTQGIFLGNFSHRAFDNEGMTAP